MIGIFDSGIGGLTVVKEFFRELPDYDILYFGDTARTPYGTKSKETIIKYAKEDARILLERGARVLLVACNSASAAAFSALQKEFPEVPIFEVITPAVKRATEVTKNKKIGVIGTNATINSGIYEQKLKEIDGFQVYSQGCPLLVPLVEEGWLDKRETKMIVKKYLHPLRQKQIDTLILGCTHYPLLKKIIQPRIGKRVALVDSAEEVVREFKEFLKNNPNIDKSLSKNSLSKFLASDVNGKFQDIAEKWLGKKVELEKVEVS